MTAAPDPSREERLARWLDGDASPEDAAALSRDLVTDRALCRRLLGSVLLERGLPDVLGPAPRASRRRDRPGPRRPRRPLARRWAHVAIAAMVVAVVVGLPAILVLRGAAPPPPVPPAAPVAIARVVAADGCTATGAVAAAGMALQAGVLLETAPAGSAALQLADGTRLELDGATRVHCASLQEWHRYADGPHAGATGSAPPPVLTLEHGCMRITGSHVPQWPFRVRTALGTVALEGTDVTIRSARGETAVAVHSGRVEIALADAPDGPSAALRGGQQILLRSGLPPVTQPIDVPWGRLLHVGPQAAYASIAALPALAPGDVVELASGTYHGATRLTASGTACRPITLRSAPGACVVFDGDGKVLSGVGEIPRALLQIEGSSWVIDGLSFRHARNGQNGAAIRCMGGGAITIRGCRIEACDDGIAGSGGSIRISDCEILACGSDAPDGLSHGIYCDDADTLVIERCLVTDTRSGVGVKAGAHDLRIESCRIQDNADGEISLLAPAAPRPDDRIILVGDVIRGRGDRGGNHQRVLAFQHEAPAALQGVLVLAYCTIQGADDRALLIDTRGAPIAVAAWDDLLVGSANIWAGDGPVSGGGNWVEARASVPATWTQTHAQDPGLRGGPHGPGQLLADAPALGAVVALPADLMVAPPRWQPPLAPGQVATPRPSTRDPGAMAGAVAVSRP